MATIRFPDSTIRNMVVSINGLASVSNTNSATIISGSGSTTISALTLYKGSIEDFSTFTDRATRAADVLITFTLPNSGNGFVDSGVIDGAARFLLGRHVATQTASASGTATWFLLHRLGTTTLTDKGAMIGSVGVTGSGSDLEIPSNVIVAGAGYQSAGFYVNVPVNRTL